MGLTIEQQRPYFGVPWPQPLWTPLLYPAAVQVTALPSLHLLVHQVPVGPHLGFLLCLESHES